MTTVLLDLFMVFRWKPPGFVLMTFFIDIFLRPSVPWIRLEAVGGMGLAFLGLMMAWAPGKAPDDVVRRC